MKCCNCGSKAYLREYLTRSGSEYGMVPIFLCPICLKETPSNFVTIIDRVCVDDVVRVSRDVVSDRFGDPGKWDYFPTQLWPGLSQVCACSMVLQADGWRVLTKVRVIPVNDAVGKPHYELHWWEPEEYTFIRRGWKHMEETRQACKV